MVVLADHPLELESQHLRLVNKDTLKLDLLEINLDYPVAGFYSQLIQPEYGTSFLSIFALPESSEIGYLLYSLPDGQQLTVELIQ